MMLEMMKVSNVPLSVYTVSKPLQYMNVLNIEDSNKKVCLILDSFSNALKIFEKIKRDSTHWTEVFFFSNYNGIYSWLNSNKNKIDKLFLDTDFGFELNWRLRKIRDLNIFIYEEGIGNYRTDIWGNSLKESFLRSMYNTLFDGKGQIGGSRYIKGMYLYDIEKHEKIFPEYRKEKLKFKLPFLEHLKTCRDSRIFFPNVVKEKIKATVGNKVVLYLTSWNYNPLVDDILTSHKGYAKLLKRHPYVRQADLNLLNFDLVIDNFVLVELAMIFLLEICDHLIVIHENSSALIYFRNKGFSNLSEILI